MISKFHPFTLLLLVLALFTVSCDEDIIIVDDTAVDNITYNFDHDFGIITYLQDPSGVQTILTTDTEKYNIKLFHNKKAGSSFPAYQYIAKFDNPLVDNFKTVQQRGEGENTLQASSCILEGLSTIRSLNPGSSCILVVEPFTPRMPVVNEKKVMVDLIISEKARRMDNFTHSLSVEYIRVAASDNATNETVTFLPINVNTESNEYFAYRTKINSKKINEYENQGILFLNTVLTFGNSFYNNFSLSDKSDCKYKQDPETDNITITIRDKFCTMLFRFTPKTVSTHEQNITIINNFRNLETDKDYQTTSTVTLKATAE